MAHMNRDKNLHVERVTEQRQPQQLRRIGRALIALARSQLEAEAAADHTAAQTSTSLAGQKRSA